MHYGQWDKLLGNNKEIEKNFRHGRDQIISLVLNGSMEININGKHKLLKKNSLVEIHPYCTVDSPVIHKGLEIYSFILSEFLIRDLSPQNFHIPLSHLVDISNNPVTILSDEEADRIKNSMERVAYYLKQEFYPFKWDALRNTLYNLFMEIGTVFTLRLGEKNENSTKDRKDELLMEFFKLLGEKGHREHNPSFYANALCISPQYLSLILKKKTNLPASKWISTRIILEAQTKLRQPGIPINTIADDLNFSDQSSFGKFYKKHTGISPREYRYKHADF
jgi:AraC-like DNA-binding protein